MERVKKLVRQLGSAGIRESLLMPAAGWYLLSWRKFDAAGRVSEYAAAVERALEGFEGELMLEPGRFLVAQAGALVTRVLKVKRNGKKTFVITDAGMNDLIRRRFTRRMTRLCRCGAKGACVGGGCGGAGV